MTLRLLVVPALLGLCACTTYVCGIGQSRPCTGEGQCTGTQTCLSDRSAFGACICGTGGGGTGGGGGGADAGGDAGTDAGVDGGSCLRGAAVELLPNVVSYDLLETDAGYAVAASQLFADGGYAAVALLLDPTLHPSGSALPLPNGASANPQQVKATSYQGIVYVAFSESTAGADVHLVSLRLDGGMSELAVIVNGDALGPATVGIDDDQVRVALMAKLNADGAAGQALLYTFPRDGGPRTELDYNLLDGGGSRFADVYSAAVSPHAQAFVWTGYDAGTDDNAHAVQLIGGTASTAPPLGSPLVLEDSGLLVRAAWGDDINFSFFGVTEDYSDAVFKANVFSVSMGVPVRQFGDHTVLRDVNLGTGIVGPVMVWTEYQGLIGLHATQDSAMGPPVVFTFAPGSGDAGTVAAPDVAYWGEGDSLALTWLDGTSGVANLRGQLVCSP